MKTVIFTLLFFVSASVIAQSEAEPAIFNTSSDILAISDIEGECTAFKKLMLKHGVLDSSSKWVFGKNHLVIVGDVFDRGNEVLEYLGLLYKMEQEAKKAGGYVHVILGNHDIMNLSGDLRYVQPKYLDQGGKTANQYIALFSRETELGKWLRTKNIIEKINDKVFVHGGISVAVNAKGMSVEQINAVCRPYYDDPRGIPDSLKLFFSGKDSPFWHRGYFNAPKASMAQVDSTLKLFGVRQIMVGHTIVPHIQTLYDGKVLAVDVNHHEGIHEAVLLKSTEQILTEKNFYLISVMDKYPELKALLPRSVVKSAELSSLRFTEAEINALNGKLLKVYDRNCDLTDQLITDLRASGNYQLYAGMDNRDLWLKVWKQYFAGVNYIIDQYGMSKKMRYPGIDSASYKAKQVDYRDKLKKGNAFYESPLSVGLMLMKLNKRDEPARHEPLEDGENSLARHRIDSIDFSRYAYSALIVPGDGPQSYIPLAPTSIKRCELAAERFRKGLAPVIILTGGYCHPIQTPYAEAMEMKEYLVGQLGIPGSAIIVDPHARHTTTNFRNPGRYLICYGFPLDKPALFVTSADHADYIANEKFDKRNMDELGYLPYRSKQRVSEHEFSFYTVKEVLHRDPLDPLDP